jgi:hypothetical protein
MQGIGTEVLLQPFAHGVADRSAGPAIDWFAVIGDSAIHDEFRFVVISNEVTHNQVAGIEIVSPPAAVAWLLGKNRMNGSTRSESEKGPGRWCAGAF